MLFNPDINCRGDKKISRWPFEASIRVDQRAAGSHRGAIKCRRCIGHTIAGYGAIKSTAKILPSVSTNQFAGGHRTYWYSDDKSHEVDRRWRNAAAGMTRVAVRYDRGEIMRSTHLALANLASSVDLFPRIYRPSDRVSDRVPLSISIERPRASIQPPITAVGQTSIKFFSKLRVRMCLLKRHKCLLQHSYQIKLFCPYKTILFKEKFKNHIIQLISRHFYAKLNFLSKSR